MKIDWITLENFGIYGCKQFRLGNAPLVLIYGPNESGKTTALNGLRQALFGFRTRTPYLTGKQMSAQVAGTLNDGQVLEFTRRKGRPDQLTGTLAGKSQSAEDVLRLLHNLDLDNYEQLFGFSLDELRKGEEALKNSRLTEALAGGGLAGIAALQGLDAELQSSLAELYKPRGSTSAINQKLNEIRQCHESLRAAQTLPSAVEELQQQLLQVQQDAEQIGEQHKQAVHARLVAQRLLDALPKFRRLTASQLQLASMELPDAIDMEFVARWSQHSEQLQQTRQRLEQEQQQLDVERQELQSLAGSEEISAAEDEIESLGHQAQEIAGWRQQLSELEQQADDASSVSEQLCETLALSHVDERLREFSVNAAVRRELELLAQQFTTNQQEMIASKAKLEAARETLAEAQSTAQLEAVPDNLLELTALVNRLRESERDLASQSRALEESLRDRGHLAIQDRLIAEVSLRDELDANWRVPTLDQVKERQEQHEHLTREGSQIQRQHTQLAKQIVRTQTELEQSECPRSDAIIAQSTTLKANRDQLLSRWLDELSQPLLAASIPTAEQRSRLLELQTLAADSDRVQDELLSVADDLAAQRQKMEQLQTLQAEQAQLQSTLEQQQVQLEAWHNDWLRLWEAVPFAPATASKMLAWLQEFAVWRDAARGLAAQQRELHDQQQRVESQRDELLELWPESVRATVPSDALEAQIRQWEASARDAQRDRQRMQTAQANASSLSERLQGLTAAQAELAERYAGWLQQCPVDIEWPLDQVGKLLDTIESLRREAGRLARLRTQIDSLRKQLADYEQRVRQTAQQLGSSIEAGPLETHAERWLSSLQTMRSDRTRRIKLNASAELRTTRIHELKTSEQELTKELQTLCKAAGIAEVARVQAIVERARQADALRSTISELSAAIEAYAAQAPQDEFRQALEQADEAELELHVRDLNLEISRLDQARQQADQDIGRLSQRIEQLANNQEAGRFQQALQDRRGELAELAEQWVVQQLAQELLRRSIDRFAAEHEPALLQFTRQYLSQLTGGRYTTVEHDNSRPASFVIRNAADEAFTPDQLSTGTREQLYLAIRMAFITHHCQRHEPLPVVMDDCFVNFDDARVRHALAAVAAWDDSIQTILLSCHWRVVASLAELAPHTPVIHLEEDRETTAGELVGRLSAILGR